MSPIRVPQAVIDEIKKRGMTAALKAGSGGDAVMREGLKRMYGEKRVAAGETATTPTTPSTLPAPSGSGSKVVKPSPVGKVSAPKSAMSAAARRLKNESEGMDVSKKPGKFALPKDLTDQGGPGKGKNLIGKLAQSKRDKDRGA